MGTATLKLENETPSVVVFWLYDAATNSARDSKVLGNGTTNIAVALPGSRLVGAWSGPSLYRNNANPDVVTTPGLQDGKTYRIVLDAGGIRFEPPA